MTWGEPGITERQLILETPNTIPSASGGLNTSILQRAGFLEKLRFQLNYQIDQSAATGAPSKSAKGPLGSALARLTLQANGMTPLIDLSGLMAQMYNEVANRDGSPLAPASYVADANISGAATLESYTAAGTGAQTYTIKYPFEWAMAVPVQIGGQRLEWGLWLLQNQTVDLALQVNWNTGYSSSANPDTPYSAGTAVVAPVNTGNTKLSIERSLYTVPAPSGKDGKANFPDINWAHQIIEYTQPIVSNFARFDIPKAGLLLRAIIYTEDASANPVEYTDISSLSWIYGANANPINRSGIFLTHEYLHDYLRYPPKGVVVLDFYKWGWDGLKLVKDTQALANLRTETNYTATSSGKQRIVLDRMVPISRMVS